MHLTEDMEQSTKDRKQRCDRSNQDTVKEVIFQMYYTQRLSLPYGLVTLELTTASFMGPIYNNIYIFRELLRIVSLTSQLITVKNVF